MNSKDRITEQLKQIVKKDQVLTELEDRYVYSFEKIFLDKFDITPDIIVEAPKMTKLETSVFTKGLNFDFVVQYAAGHEDIDKDFEVDDKVLRDFAVYLMEKELEFNEEEYDSAKTSFKKRLKQNIFTNLWGLKEGYRVRVANDPLVHKAVEMLKEVETQLELYRFAEKQ